MTIPGIGPIVATVLPAAVGDGRQFRRARDMAAWLGLVPREHSTGGKTTLFGISKRGNRYVRRLLIHGARSCVLHLDRTRDRLGSWLKREKGAAVAAQPSQASSVPYILTTRCFDWLSWIEAAISGRSVGGWIGGKPH